MAVIREVDYKVFNSWLEDKPKIIKELADKIPPGRLYSLKTTNYRVFPFSYEEDGTLTVIVNAEYNNSSDERRIYSVKPEDLKECDLPDKTKI